MTWHWLHMQNKFLHVSRLLLHSHYLEWICWLDMHNTWENGCYWNACFSLAVPSASPCSQNGHLYALKRTSQHCRPMALDAMPGKKRRRKRRKTEKPRAATHYCWPLSSSHCPPCLSCLLLYQSPYGPLASIFLSLPVGSHQSVDLPWMLALSANYTVYLTTVTAMARKICGPLFVNP